MSETNKHIACDVSSTKSECNKSKAPQVSIGKIFAKIPVLLAELELQLHVDAKITFPEPVLEIKDIKKRVVLTQCRLLLPSDKLFIKGFVRKNIQYASPSKEIAESTDSTVSSDLHSLTTEVPFECVTEITKYLSTPVMPKINKREEFDFGISKSLPSGFPEKDKLLTSDLSQFHQESMQYYNELPYCELLSSKILEWDEALDRTPLPDTSPFNEGYFTTVEEKMVLHLCLKVLQNQQVRITSTTNDDPIKPCKHDTKMEEYELDIDLDS